MQGIGIRRSPPVSFDGKPPNLVWDVLRFLLLAKIGVVRGMRVGEDYAQRRMDG